MKLFLIISLSILSQKDLSNRMLYWCRKAACLITFITRHVAGHSFDGIKLALQLARNVICKCAASQCCCPAESHCSQASSLFAVQNTLKVNRSFFISLSPLSLFFIVDVTDIACHCDCEAAAWKRIHREMNCLSLNLFPFSSTRFARNPLWQHFSFIRLTFFNLFSNFSSKKCDKVPFNSSISPISISLHRLPSTFQSTRTCDWKNRLQTKSKKKRKTSSKLGVACRQKIVIWCEI